MKYDWQHDESNFVNLTEDDLTSVSTMKSLSSYLKKNHFLLNQSAEGYNARSWVETDNIFPEDIATHPMTHIEWAANIDKYGGEGDVLEFGVACGGTIRDVAPINSKRRIHGFDHFEGLEQTQQPIPSYAGWHEGAFRLNGPEYPQTVEGVLEDLSQFDNISIIIEDVHNLEEPSEYEIKKIGAVHIDVDIYEPTVSSLNFVDKCEWDKIYMRFDDWHGHESDYDKHERLACKEWLDKNNYKYDLLRNGLHGEMIVYR